MIKHLLKVVVTEFQKDAEVSPVQNYWSLSVFADVYDSEIPTKIADNYANVLFGEVALCNMSDTGVACVTVTGFVTKPHAASSLNFEDGGLLLESTTENCKLRRQYDGKSSLNGSSFVINSDVEVTCGTGIFKANHGQLKKTITGQLPTEDNPSPIYELTLNSQLEN